MHRTSKKARGFWIMVTVLAAQLATGPPAAAGATLEPVAYQGPISCDPSFEPVVAYALYHCEPGSFVQGSHLIVVIRSGSASNGLAPSALDLRASAAAGYRAAQTLAASMPSVSYRWQFAPWELPHIFVWKDQFGSSDHFIDLRVSATHSRCAACSVTVRKILVGRDPSTGASGPSAPGQPTTISLTLKNRGGGKVPPGEVRLSAEYRAVSLWDADPVFLGGAFVRGTIRSVSLTSSV